MDARIAPPFMEATDASRLVCVVVVSYQEYSLTHTCAVMDERPGSSSAQDNSVVATVVEDTAIDAPLAVPVDGRLLDRV